MSKNSGQNGSWVIIINKLLQKGDLIILPIVWWLLLTKVPSGRLKVLGYLCVTISSVVAAASRTRIGRLIFQLIAKAINDRVVPFIKRKLRPEWKPHQLVGWLTKGRIDANVSCHQSKNRRIRKFKGMRCRRETCRFCLRKEQIPKLFLRIIPRRAKSVKQIRLSAYELLMKEGELSPEAIFEQWDSLGITIRMDSRDWGRLQKSLKEVYKVVPHILTAYIPVRFPKEARIRVEPLRTHPLRDGSTIIFGKFADKFEPIKIRRDQKKWLSIPMCQAWEAQGKRPNQCEYIRTAPDRLKVLS